EEEGVPQEILITLSLTAAAVTDVVRLGQVMLQLISPAPRLWSQVMSGSMASSQVVLTLYMATASTKLILLLCILPVFLDLLVCVLQLPEEVLGYAPQSPGFAPSRIGRRTIDMDESQLQWRVVELDNFIWPSRGSQVLDEVVQGSNLNTSCMVCLADFEGGEMLSVLPCGHNFHATCISSWHQHLIIHKILNKDNDNNYMCPCRCTKSQLMASSAVAVSI
ncbi:unnamed protein product, partial [Polarella glacialis]